MSEVSIESAVDQLIETEREFERQYYPDDQLEKDDASTQEAGSQDEGDFGGQATDRRDHTDGGQQGQAQQDGASAKSADTAATQQSAQQTQQRPEGWLNSDAQGNLVDASGKIVARAGSERRLYESTIRARHELSQERQARTELYGQYQQLQQQVQQLQQRAQMHRQYGLDDAEMQEGLGFLQQWKQNPLQVAEQVLTTLGAQGYDLSTLIGQFIQVGEDGQVRVAPRQQQPNVHQMVNQAVQPYVQQQNQQRQIEEARTRLQQEAVNAANNFLMNPNYPYARVHEETLARMIQRDTSRSLTPEGAYAQLAQFAATNGLDLSQPLAPQIRARQQQQQQPQQPQQRQPSLTPGNAGPSNVNAMNQPPVNSADDDYNSIVRQAMRDAGMA